MARKASKVQAPPDRVTDYARDVVEGRILAGRLVRLACQRHLDDLERGHERGLTWSSEKANRALHFIESFCRLAGGEHEGKPFVLSPHQVFCVGSVYGWLGPDGYRRFRVLYWEEAKGGGKSPTAAAVGNYMLVGDGEERAEVYAAAVHKEQAGVLFRDAVAMLRQSPDLLELVEISGAFNREWNIAYHETNSFFRTISTENQGRGKSGPRPHCALLDEVHEHATDAMVEFMRAGTKGRRQALIFLITNSGADRTSVAWHLHEYSQGVLEAKSEDDRYWNDAWFAYVCQLDACEKCRSEGKTQPQEGCPDCDDWRDERVWKKANPNLGVTIQPQYLREQVREAVGMPSKAGTVKRLNFCIWTEGADRWIDIDLWDACAAPVDQARLRGRKCFAGLDLSSTTDLSSLVLTFPPDERDEEPALDLVPFFWCPKEQLLARARRDGVPYDLWAQQGYIEPTDGDVIDYDFIEARICWAAETFEILELGYDPYNAMALITRLMARGIKCVPVRQGMLTLSPPTKALEVRIANRTVRHGGHPILRWNVGNAAAVSDPSGNKKLVKPSDTARIDGLAAAVNAIERMDRHDLKPTVSIYETRGLLRL